jgi:hypothetical protein
MNVTAAPKDNLVTIRGDRGTEITMNWAAAAHLSTLLNEASRQAEPSFPGKSYCPSVERDRR